MDIRVKLIEVQGEEQSEFADLLDLEGTLDNNPKARLFNPDNSNDTLTMPVKSIKDETKYITVKTKLGNTFIFQKL